jgi:hypothetical protein
VFAVLLGETSLHVRGSMGKVLLAAAAYLVVLAMLSRGPLGAIRILGPRLHRALDLVLVVGLAVSPIIVRSNIDVAGVIVAEALAIVVLRLAFRTHYLPAPVPARIAGATSRPAAPMEADPPRARVAEADGSPPPATPGGGDGAPPGAAKPPARPRPVPSTAWTLGVLAARARRRGNGADRALGAGARRLGTALGRSNRRRGG